MARCQAITWRNTRTLSITLMGANLSEIVIEVQQASVKHYNDVIMSPLASPITSLTIVYSIVIQAQIEEKIKAPRHWPLWGEFTGDRWIPRGKSFHLMTSSWELHLKCSTHGNDLDTFTSREIVPCTHGGAVGWCRHIGLCQRKSWEARETDVSSKHRWRHAWNVTVHNLVVWGTTVLFWK